MPLPMSAMPIAILAIDVDAIVISNSVKYLLSENVGVERLHFLKLYALSNGYTAAKWQL